MSAREQLPEPAIGGPTDDDGHVGSTSFGQLLYLMHGGLLVQPAAGRAAVSVAPARKRAERQGATQHVCTPCRCSRTHLSWGPPSCTQRVRTCLPVARSTDSSSAAFSSSSPRPRSADTARTPGPGDLYLCARDSVGQGMVGLCRHLQCRHSQTRIRSLQ